MYDYVSCSVTEVSNDLLSISFLKDLQPMESVQPVGIESLFIVGHGPRVLANTKKY